MALDFTSSETLNAVYTVLGHFYDVALTPSKVVPCRSVLEIVHADDYKGGIRMQPDAIFIMMNPGSSAPLKATSTPISSGTIGTLLKTLVPTKPDTTQYQLMRVMKYREFRHVRVINLSDLRETRSERFFELYETLEREHDFTEHSIFSPSRKSELQRALQRNPGAPLVRAWGVGTRLAPLITRCIASIGNEIPAAGLLKPLTGNRYYHPLPQTQDAQRMWVENMVAHLSLLIEAEY